MPTKKSLIYLIIIIIAALIAASLIYYLAQKSLWPEKPAPVKKTLEEIKKDLTAPSAGQEVPAEVIQSLTAPKQTEVPEDIIKSLTP